MVRLECINHAINLIDACKSAGYGGLWSNGGCDFMVCTDERPFIRLSF